jgi:hypothetical protein
MENDAPDPFDLATNEIYCCRRSKSAFYKRTSWYSMSVRSEEWFGTPKRSSIEIRRGPLIEAYLLKGNHGRDFSLRMHSQYGTEVMTCHFGRDPAFCFRTLTVHCYPPDGVIVLKSRQPHIGPLGGWSLNLGSRPALQSRKNCRLESADHAPVLYIRKCMTDGLEIETLDDGIKPICVFAISIGAFLFRK